VAAAQRSDCRQQALEYQQVIAAGPIQGSGLRLLPVVHSGNQNSSPEEAERIHALVQTLINGKSQWVDMDGNAKPLTLDDVLIIAPYNAQVFELQARLPGARIGTVDKFQGQEAPVVIYSLTTSTQADAPHGMEFLYSLNRLNVATSRARCVCILVASPGQVGRATAAPAISKFQMRTAANLQPPAVPKFDTSPVGP
jgi:AAA domain